MEKLNKILIILRAIVRLSPCMALFMCRRLLRNQLAVIFPNAYRNRIYAIRKKIPDLIYSNNKSLALTKVTEFYCSEYRKMSDGIFDGKVCLHGREIDFGSADKINWNYYVIDEEDHQMWRVKLGHMGFICPLLVDNNESKNDEIVSVLLQGAIKNTDMTSPGAFNGFWFPYAASHRVLAICSGLIEAWSKGYLSSDLESIVVDFLKLNTAFILDNIEYELCNNHVERNLAALCLYFSYVEKVPKSVSLRLERSINKLIERTILDDGTQVERSPMYQGLSVYSLQVMAESSFLSDELRKRVSYKLELSRQAFAILCHPDGEVALFNDSWHGEVPRLIGSTVSSGRYFLPDGGYGRLSQNQDICLMDAGPIGPTWNPGHGHADFLSIEITLSGHRVIVDPGTSCYNTGEDRLRERSAAAHNGPIYLEYEPVEFLGCFKVGRMAKAKLVHEKYLPSDAMAGLLNVSRSTVGRFVKHYFNQGYLIADLWTTQAKGHVTWLIPSNWELISSDCGFTLRDNTINMTVKIFNLSSNNVGVPMSSNWARYYGHKENAHALCFSPACSTEGQTLLTWIGYDAPPKNIQIDGDFLLAKLKKIVVGTQMK